ncbi:MAG: aminotransferase class V-fold PLP-dependent enzyme [Syntrophomonadaceae bacterium]|jgi:cysteine desulfurase family protein
MADSIYMNNAATTWPKPEQVYRAIDDFNRNLGANPGRGSNRNTLQAGMILVETRDMLASLFNIADSNNIAFALNVTQAINMALKGILKPGDHAIITGMEHNAVARPLFWLEKQGVEISLAPCAPDGSLDPAAMEALCRENTRVICMLHASNVTGTIMPVEEVGRVARRRGIVFIVDAAQTAGVLPIDVEQMNIDILCFAGHKGLLGPQGTGGLYVNPDIDIATIIQGGTGSLSEFTVQPDFMPDKLESGTLNTPGIAGLLAGLQYLRETGLQQIRNHEKKLTDMLITGLQEIKGVTLYGPRDSNRQTAVVLINLEGMDCGELSSLLDHKYGIITRSGLHCAPMAHRTIGTLKAGGCRFSPGLFTTEKDIAKTCQAVYAIANNR